MDSELAQLEANWRSRPNDVAAQSAALAAFREARVDAPLDLIFTCPDWLPFIEFADAWFREPVGNGSGYSIEQLNYIERIRGIEFPPTAREWWRIAGKHPCCGAWDESWYGHFIRPDSPDIRSGDLWIAHLDDNVGIRLLIHRSQLDKPNPDVLEHNEIEDPKNYVIDKCVKVGATLPQAIWQTMISLACSFGTPPSVLKEDIFILEEDLFLWYDREDPHQDYAHIFSIDRKIDWTNLWGQFGLQRCPYGMFFGDVAYDGSTVILSRFKMAVRTVEKMREMDNLLSSRGSFTMGLGTRLQAWRAYEETETADGRVLFETRTGRRFEKAFHKIPSENPGS